MGAAQARRQWDGFSKHLRTFWPPRKPQASPRAKRAVLERFAGKPVGCKPLPSQVPAVQSTLAFGLRGSWSFVACGDVQAEAGGSGSLGCHPRLGCGGQAGGAAACVRQSRKSWAASARSRNKSSLHPGAWRCPNQRCAWEEGWRGARLGRSLPVQEEGREEADREPWAAQGGGSKRVWGDVGSSRAFGAGNGDAPPSPFLARQTLLQHPGF